MASDLDEQRVRAARNQSLFREVNERVQSLYQSPPYQGFTASAFVEFVCECTIDGCAEHVSLTLEEYEGIRRGANRFFVLPEHVIDQVEQVIESTDRYLVVAKLGAGRAVAESLDPRA